LPNVDKHSHINDRKLSDGGGLAQPVRAKAARVGCMAAGAVKGSVAGGSARWAAQAVTARSRSLQRLVSNPPTLWVVAARNFGLAAGGLLLREGERCAPASYSRSANGALQVPVG